MYMPRNHWSCSSKCPSTSHIQLTAEHGIYHDRRYKNEAFSKVQGCHWDQTMCVKSEMLCGALGCWFSRKSLVLFLWLLCWALLPPLVIGTFTLNKHVFEFVRVVFFFFFQLLFSFKVFGVSVKSHFKCGFLKIDATINILVILRDWLIHFH